MLNIGVLVSGGGSNLQAIIDQKLRGNLLNVKISLVVSSREGVFAIERAQKHEIPCVVLSPKRFSSRKDYHHALISILQEYHVQLVVLAGYHIILGDEFLKAFENRVINVHPSLIPSFCGKGYYGLVPHQRAIEYGVKVSGATVHFVELEADKGPIILQDTVKVFDEDTPESLQKRVLEEVEWKILPEAIRLFSEGRLEIRDRRVHITNI